MVHRTLATILIVFHLLVVVRSVPLKAQEVWHILHNPITQAQEKQSINISAELKGSPSGTLMYIMVRKTGKKDFLCYSMDLVGGNLFQGDIPAKLVTQEGLEYYLRLQDPVGKVLARYPEDESFISMAIKIPQPPQEVPLQEDISEEPEMEKATEEIIVPPSIPSPADVPKASTPIISEEPRPVAIVPQPVTEVVADQPVELRAELTGLTEGKLAYLMYRKLGQKDFRSTSMMELGEGMFRGQIPAKAVTIEGLEYYIKVVDSAGRSLACFPDDGSFLSLIPTTAEISEEVLRQEELPPPVAPDKPVIVPEETKKTGLKKWHWMGLGALAVAGVIALVMSGGDGSGDGDHPSASKLPDPPDRP